MYYRTIYPLIGTKGGGGVCVADVRLGKVRSGLERSEDRHLMWPCSARLDE